MTPVRTSARRRSPLRALVITVIVLAGVLVVADRAALAVAENAAATTLQRSEHLDQRPKVTIEGFPFLTQLAAGHFGAVRVHADGVQVGDQSARLRIARVDMTLHDVHVSRNFRSGRSDSATADALISYSDLSNALNTRFAYAGNGRVQAKGSVSVAGVMVSGSATAAVRLTGDRLTFGDERVDVGGVDVPQAVTGFFANLFSASISLAGLPFGVHVDALHADNNGIGVVLTAHGITFSR
jgi:hypothetical protein